LPPRPAKDKAADAAATKVDLLTQKEIVFREIPAAVAHVSGGGGSRYNVRQLFYAIRPKLIEAIDREPLWGTFCKIVTEYEDAQGHDLPGVYRDNRGSLYTPHDGTEMPLGTLSVEAYRRPEWVFNKILYCEKEGFFPLLRDAGFPERYDCALLTSKGFATRAARDVIDLLGETKEPITFLCIHDADAHGTVIYEKLVKATLARPARKVRVLNLGLEPGEALAMRLQVEPVERRAKRRPVAGYVTAEWAEWLQTHRVELNAMTSRQFVAWLSGKMDDLAGKVIPPIDVLRLRLRLAIEGELERLIRERILKEADIDGRVRAAFRAAHDGLKPLIADTARSIKKRVSRELKNNPRSHWAVPVSMAGYALARRGAEPKRKRPGGRRG
jgi:hypothetical protein